MCDPINGSKLSRFTGLAYEPLRLGLRMPPSPSPQPSPFGRGRTIRCFRPQSKPPERSPRGTSGVGVERSKGAVGCSLSLRERVRVRGNPALHRSARLEYPKMIWTGRVFRQNRQFIWSFMRTPFRTLNDENLDLEDLQVEWAAQKATLEAIHRARQSGTEFVIWADNHPKSLKSNETAPYEEAAIANLRRLEQRIARLREHDTESVLVLKDRPKS
jgi:hypothetical protein